MVPCPCLWLKDVRTDTSESPVWSCQHDQKQGIGFIIGEVMGIELERMRSLEVEKPEDFGITHFQADLKMFKHDRLVNSG